MLDATLRRLIDPPLHFLGRQLASRGIDANFVTLTGLALGIGAGIAVAFRFYEVALGFLLLNRLADGLDGAIARAAAPSDLGGYLDIVADFLFYSGFVFAFALSEPSRALPAAFLIFSFVGTGSSFLAFAAIAAKRGLSSERRGRKSLYYLGGLTEGSETIALFIALCLWPEWFSPLAWLFGALCWLTTATRVIEAYRVFAENEKKDAF